MGVQLSAVLTRSLLASQSCIRDTSLAEEHNTRLCTVEHLRRLSQELFTSY